MNAESSVSEKRVVVVTGAGSGLGRALSSKFVDSGYRVFGFGRNESTLAETSQLINSDQFSYQCVDVSDFVSVQRAFDSIVADCGRIDYLFNNAAVYPKVNFLDESAEHWSTAIDINVNGPANCCKAVLPTMIRAGFGRIYNLGSFANLGPIQNSAAYSCSKGAIHSLGLAIQADIAELDVDIEVHEWIPGHLRTQMSEFTGIDPEISAEWGLNIANMPAFGKSQLFVNDRVRIPPKGIRKRIKDVLTLRFLRKTRN